MGNDDKLDRDAERGQKDIAAQVRRFNRVADIVARAIARYDQIAQDIGAAGPSNDPTVQAALQAIDTNCQTLLNRVQSQPGPIQDPAVRQTLQGIVGIGTQLANDASAKLGVPAPCAVGARPAYPDQPRIGARVSVLLGPPRSSSTRKPTHPVRSITR